MNPLHITVLGTATVFSLFASSVQAAVIRPVVSVDTQISRLSLTGESLMGLERLSGGGYDELMVQMNLSSSNATGRTMLTLPSFEAVSSGDALAVESFFDVFFNLTLEDTDPSKNFLPALGSGPLSFFSSLTLSVRGAPCIADTSRPNYGCVLPTGIAYQSGPVIFDLGADIDGNGFGDVIELLIADFTLSNPSMGPDGITYDTLATIEGGVMDLIADPPFTFNLSGPTILAAPPIPVPAPATLALLGAGLGVLGWARRRASLL